jgi:hypothetical protein
MTKLKVKEEGNNIKKLEEENKKLKNELEEIKKMLLNLTQNQEQVLNAKNTNIIVENNNNDDDEDFEIRPNKYIKVMSLNFGKLVLTTEGKGRGKAFVFNKFGDVKNIVYSELANLIHHQQTFAEEGRFYIFDKNVVRNHGLIEYYNKFLTKEVIDNILEYNRDEIVDLFKNTTDAQREVIVNILIKKIVDGEDVDIAKVDIISRLSGQNIYDIARDKMMDK